MLGRANENKLFNEFNLKVETREFVSIIGSNGSGKSTLLNIGCGSLKEDSGEVLNKFYEIREVGKSI